MAILTRATAVFLLSFCLAITAFAGKRVALVIGNSEYKLAPLKNPTSDADDLTAALKRLHFDVIERKDLTIRAFDDALDEFVAKSKAADIAMFFFSGHGVQIDKRGFLAPIDVKAETESSALRELVAIQEVVSRTEHAAKVSVIVLDACRDSPLQERLRRIAVEKNKELEPPKGLPPVSVVGSDTLIVYATVPGETASDGAGRNSPFTTAFLKHIETPGLDLELIFKRVTADVLIATGGKQQPERLSRLQSELILREDTAEQQLWDSVKDSGSPDAVGTYLTKYPKGNFAPVARALIKQIEQQRLLEQALKEEEKRRAEVERKEAEFWRLEEDLKSRLTVLEERRRQEAAEKAAALKAEEPRKQDEAKLAEEKRRAEESKAAAVLKQQEEKWRQESAEKAAALKAEDQRKQDEAKLAEEKKRAEEAKAAALLKQQEDKQREDAAQQAASAPKAGENHKAEEAKPGDEQLAKQAQEIKKLKDQLAEELRIAREAARAAEQKRIASEKSEAEARKKAEESGKASQRRRENTEKQTSLGKGETHRGDISCVASSCSQQRRNCVAHSNGRWDERCSGWYRECVKTGDWNGRLCQHTGLARN
ncbi:MAG: caspase family protein [Rhodomicrobium sp.]